jgi:hypothetical protein
MYVNEKLATNLEKEEPDPCYKKCCLHQSIDAHLCSHILNSLQVCVFYYYVSSIRERNIPLYLYFLM